MKLIRFEINNLVKKGILYKDENIVEIEGDFLNYSKTGNNYTINDVKLLAPIVPGKIICIGLNYHDHAKEMNFDIPDEPVLFIKPPTALIGPNDYIKYPKISTQVDYEAELAIVISKKGKYVAISDANDYILGYTCANDVTARDIQSKDGQWTRAKSFDTFLPLGPYIETEINPSELAIKTIVNGEIKQNSNTREMIFSIPYIVSFVSQVMTLEYGDVIITGTPHGIGPLQIEDEVIIEIEGIGCLKNIVRR